MGASTEMAPALHLDRFEGFDSFDVPAFQKNFKKVKASFGSLMRAHAVTARWIVDQNWHMLSLSEVLKLK